jgi:hypothetical protein
LAEGKERREVGDMRTAEECEIHFEINRRVSWPEK